MTTMTTMNKTRGLKGVLGAAAAMLLTAAAHAQDITPRAKPQTMPVAITNATIHPVSGPVIENGFVLFDQGKIVEVGAMTGGRVFTGTTRVIDAKGKHVAPGMITPITQMGITEIGSLRAPRDFNETGDATPEVYAAVAVNPDSWLFPVARVNGVLASGVFPSGGSIPGRVSVMRHEGWTWEDMAVKRDAGLIVSWPNMRTITAWWMDRSEEDQRKDRERAIDRIRETFRLARAYIAQKDGPDGASTPVDLRWEAMRGVLATDPAKKLPVFMEAQEFDQINAAISFALEQGLKPVIVGGRDAVLCTELLKKHDIPVIFNSVMSMPRRDDAGYDDAYATPAKLEAAGVRFTLASGEESPHERNLPYAAGMAVAHGLAPDAALKAVTLGAAQILGVADSLGTLEQGKEATLLVSTAHPLEVTSQIEMIFIQGQDVTLDNKQSALAEKYREKYRREREAKDGR